MNHVLTRGLLAALFLSALACVAFADDALGSLAYMEGDVTIVRDGEEIAALAIGQDIQNFDLVRTGPDGLAEIELTGGGAPRATLKVSHGTQFSVEIATLQGKQQTTIGVIGGVVALKVSRLTGTQALTVRTDSTVMGVRGTGFTVTAPATGDVLVTCDEGDVVCTNALGRALHAVPGSAVENRADMPLLSTPFRVSAVPAAEIGTYTTAWVSDRARDLEKNALALIKANARLYQQLARELAAANADLLKSQAIITKWQSEDKAGKIGQRAELARERLATGAALARLRQIQFRMERIEFRLETLRGLHDRGIGTGAVDGGETTAAFFQQLEKDRREVERKLAFARYVAKLYAKRNDGALP